ncbi:MAG: magnesium transporter MgtE [Gemmatales bacterium]|nr:MAG: magnesium transporter MgtE [Gemmatales bacterium]
MGKTVEDKNKLHQYVKEPVDELRESLRQGNVERVRACLENLPHHETARVVSQLSEEEQSQLLLLLPDEEAADLLESLPESHAAQLVENMDTSEAAEILNEVESDEQADILGRLREQSADAILLRMEPAEAADARRLMQYPRDSAGGLMISEYVAYPDNFRVEDVLADLRQNARNYREYDVQYLYVTDGDAKLVGVLRLRDLLLADPDDTIASLMIRDPLAVDVETPLEALERFFERHPFFGVPVIDRDKKLVGVVRQQDVEAAAESRSGRTMLKFTGILGGEELRSMPLRLRSLRRLSWLSINIVLNIIAASVIAFHQDTLAQVIALAVFLPIISDMSGCSGNQAVAVSMRELALGLTEPADCFRVLLKEAAVGLINGFTLGLLLGLVAFGWKGIPALGLVVGAAMFLNTVVAVCIGGSVPLILKGLNHDPALASGPILTTITDMCGFFLVLSFAQYMLPWLV